MVSELYRQHVQTVVVVDNGSRDATVARALAAGARVVVERRRGYGSACSAGVVAAAALAPDVVVFADGDGADVLDDLPSVVDPVVEGHFDLVVGARRPLRPLPVHVRVGNRIAVALLRYTTGLHATDLGPLRAIRYATLTALHLRDRRCGWTAEMQARAAVLGARVGEVPVRYVPRSRGSKISGTMRGSCVAAYDILRTIARVARTRGQT